MSKSSRDRGGTYIPPAKRVKQEKFDEGTEEYQRLQWDENKKKITGLINRANASNVIVIVKELFQHNLVRYRGLFVSALIKAQEISPSFTDVYAALAAVINCRIHGIGVLLINRLILQFRTYLKSENKTKCLSLVKFIAHLVNQEVVHNELAYDMMKELMSKPNPLTIEIVIELIKHCGAKLNELDSVRLSKYFRQLNNLDLDYNFDNRTHDLIQLVHIIKKDSFKEYPTLRQALDLVDEDDRQTHEIGLDDPTKEDFKTEMNYFKFDPSWKQNEEKYEEFKRKALGEGDESSQSDDSSGESDSELQAEKPDVKVKQEQEPIEKKVDIEQKVIDATGKDLTAFRRKIYLTICSSVSHEEAVHKLIKSNIPAELNEELCQMIIDCCGQSRTYMTVYGLIASKLCQINRRSFAPKFETIFKLFYETVHMYETNKLRNIARFFGHLLATESIDWSCLSCIKLRENATTSSGRCYIRFLFQELVSILSLRKLIEYTKEPDKQIAFADIFPRDEEQDIRFAINFFTCSNLGALAEDLRKELASRNER